MNTYERAVWYHTKRAHKLLKARRLMIKYLKLRLKLQDWHGVMDAAADIREIEAKLSVLDELGPSRW